MLNEFLYSSSGQHIQRLQSKLLKRREEKGKHRNIVLPKYVFPSSRVMESWHYLQGSCVHCGYTHIHTCLKKCDKQGLGDNTRLTHFYKKNITLQ